MEVQDFIPVKTDAELLGLISCAADALESAIEGNLKFEGATVVPAMACGDYCKRSGDVYLACFAGAYLLQQGLVESVGEVIFADSQESLAVAIFLHQVRRIGACEARGFAAPYPARCVYVALNERQWVLPTLLDYNPQSPQNVLKWVRTLVAANQHLLPCTWCTGTQGLSDR